MQIKNISLITYNNTYYPTAQTKSFAGSDIAASEFETSIYNQKAVTLPFGAWASGANEAELACINMFRKVREHRHRKYTEPEIIEFMKELKDVPPENKIEDIIKEFFMTYKACHEEFGAELAHPAPDADLVKNYLKIAKNCDEFDRLGLMGFLQHELCSGATKPLKALAAAAPEHQRHFVKIMNDISFDTTDSGKSEALLDDLRHVIYALEDSPELDAKGKLQYLSDVWADYKDLKNSPNIPQRVVDIAKNIVETMVDVLQI